MLSLSKGNQVDTFEAKIPYPDIKIPHLGELKARLRASKTGLSPPPPPIPLYLHSNPHPINLFLLTIPTQFPS